MFPQKKRVIIMSHTYTIRKQKVPDERFCFLLIGRVISKEYVRFLYIQENPQAIRAFHNALLLR